MEWSNHHSMYNKYCTSWIFFERAERPGITPAVCTFALVCFPPHACPLLLQWQALLSILSLMQTDPQWAHLHIYPQAPHQGLCFRLFPLLHPGTHLPHFLPLFCSLYMQGHPHKLSGTHYFMGSETWLWCRVEGDWSKGAAKRYWGGRDKRRGEAGWSRLLGTTSGVLLTMRELWKAPVWGLTREQSKDCSPKFVGLIY